jgi:hypothetical protein
LQVPAGRMFAPGAVGGKWALLFSFRCWVFHRRSR